MSDKKDVYVAHEKHGVHTYASAMEILRRRIEEGYWYYDTDATAAKEALKKGSEDAAYLFLRRRNDYEYEYVEKQTLK